MGTASMPFGGTTAGGEPVVVYEPTGSKIPPLRRYLSDIWRRRPFIWEMSRSDLKAEHYDTVFGQAWLLLNPLLMAAVWLLVREVIRPAGTAENRQDIIAHLIIGIFMFQYTANLIGSGTNAIISRKAMIMNTPFPRAIFPIVDLTKALVELVPTAAVYLTLHVLLGQPVTWQLLWFPAFVAAQTLFTFGVVLLLAAVTVYFRDMANLTRYILRLWMFCSPILYTVAEIPPNLLWLLQLNPLFPFFAGYEDIFDGVSPGIGMFLWGMAWAVGAFVVGAVVFLRKERDFAIWL